MTTLREAAQQAKQAPLRELLASVPADARLVIDDADGKGTRFIPVGRLCREAAAALAEPVQEPVATCDWPQCGKTWPSGFCKCVPDTAPLNLNDPAVQKRLAAQWGYTKQGAEDAQV